MHDAIEEGASVEVIQLIIKEYPDALKVKDNNGRLPLYHAVSCGASVEVIQLLVKEYPDAVRKKDDFGSLPLHWAVGCGASDEVIQLLVKEYPDALKEKNEDGVLPLYRAIKEDASAEVIKLLITEYPDALKEKYGEGRLQQNSAASAEMKTALFKTPGSLLNSVKNQKRSLAVEYTRLRLQFESALIQHKLALQYYEFRSFYFVFLPVTLIATLITIIGFLISGISKDDVDDGTAQAQGSTNGVDPLLTGDSKQIWSLVVGILGAIATLVNSIGKRANYQSQSDMHRSAVKALEKIRRNVDFEKEWFDRKVYRIGNPGSGFNNDEDLVTELGADLKTHQASFKAMLDACCDSPIPEQVVQAFTLLDQIFRMHPPDKVDMFTDLSPLMFHYHKLWREYSKCWYWPLKPPSIKVSTKYKKWKKEMKTNYYDADDDPPFVTELQGMTRVMNIF